MKNGYKIYSPQKIFSQIGFVLLALSVYIFPAQAKTQYLHQTADSVSIEMDLAESDDYKIEKNQNILQISFTRPLAENLAQAQEELSQYIATQNISTDKKQIAWQLKKPCNVKSYKKGNKLNIVFSANPAGKTSKIDNKDISAAWGKHEGFNRFTFEYVSKPQYKIRKENQSIVLSVLTPIDVDIKKLSDYPEFYRIEKRQNKLGGYDITLPGRLKNAFEHNNKLVLDMESTTPPQQVAKIEEQGLGIRRNMTTLANSVEDPQKKEKVASLAFPWNIEVGLSVFTRGKYIWIIFDHSQNIDLDDLRNQSRAVVDEIIQVPHSQGTILRILPKKNVKVGLRQEGLLWIVDLYTHNIEYKVEDMPIYIQYDSMRQSYLYIPTMSGGNVISVIDPEVGDVIYAGTDTEIRQAISKEYTYQDLEILPSKQGFAFVSNTSDINVTKGNSGFSIKANNRGLNISDNLETLQRQQLLEESASHNIFDLKIPQQILNMNYLSAVQQLKEDIAKASPEKKKEAELQLIKYYIGMGLGSETLNAVRSLQKKSPQALKPEEVSALNGMANFLMRRYDEAVDNFSDKGLEDSNEAVFWRALASSAIEYQKENNAVLLSFIFVIKDYPQELKERIALVAAETAILSYDDISTQNFMDILKQSQSKGARRAHILYLNAKKSELQGYHNNALREYNVTSMYKSQKYSSLARYAKVKLELQLNLIKLSDAIRELERLRFAWGEPKFKLELLNTLAKVYAENKDYTNALRTYQESLSLADSKQQDQILDKMVKLFEDLYINNLADEMTSVKAIALYKDFEWLAAKSRSYTQIAQNIADRMVAADLLDSAANLLKEQLRFVNLSPLTKAQIGARLALIYLFEADNIGALEVLDNTASEGLPANLRQYRKIIRAKGLMSLNKNKEALALLEDDYSKNAILLKTDIYWQDKQWDQAAENIKYLIEKPKPGQELSQEQIKYILDWITALKKAEKDTTIFRIRNTFMPYFEKTPYASSFKVLTSNLETDRVDMNAIDQAVENISAYSDFSKIYDASLLKENYQQPDKN